MFLFVNILQAQSPVVKQATIQALKMAFLTKDINLSPEEAQRFWPVYNAYIEELKKIRKDTKDDVLAFEEKSLAAKKRYNIEFKKILSSEERANKVFLADRNFALFIKKELDERQRLRNQQKSPNETDKSNKPQAQ